jgi:short-subunit dehydrogenase
MVKAGLITGASSGIGKELARIHASRGNNVVLVARRVDALNELAIELRDKYSIEAHVFAVDLRNMEEVEQLISTIKSTGIFINYLFNNAGFGGWGKFSDRSASDDHQMIAVNVQALTALTHGFLPEMIEKNEGKILHTASTAGFIPGPLQATYFATKAFVVSLTRATNYELRNTGVSVTALCPGPVKTEFEFAAGMGNSKMFEKGADAYSTALKGYKAMMKGKSIIISDLSFHILINYLSPFIPKIFILKVVEKIQTK